jgi:hypothetical protein
VLRDAGVVRDAAQGRHRVYSIDAARLERYRRQLDQFWSDALGKLGQASIEQERDLG